MIRRLTLAALLITLIALTVAPAGAQDKGMAMPPGMTPEIMQRPAFV